jgi:rubredoxin
MKKYECKLCGFIYDETQGDQDFSLDPGTTWEEVPEDYVCPLCGAGKEDFELLEE